MIREFLESIFTPVSGEARRLGYLYETIALRGRYRRRKKEWQNHIDKCHAAILSATKKFGAKHTLMILGSGPLNEIPMRELTARFGDVILVDFVHPREVRRHWGRHPQVQLVEKDLLGLAKNLLAWKSGPLPEPKPPVIQGADFVISANCLSQLALKPRQFLEKSVGEKELADYCERISESHLRAIVDSKIPHLVIADFETRVIEKDGSASDVSHPFFNFEQLRLIDSWIWRLAPPGEIYYRKSVEMSVGAFTIRAEIFQSGEAHPQS